MELIEAISLLIISGFFIYVIYFFKFKKIRKVNVKTPPEDIKSVKPMSILAKVYLGGLVSIWEQYCTEHPEMDKTPVEEWDSTDFDRYLQKKMMSN